MNNILGEDVASSVEYIISSIKKPRNIPYYFPNNQILTFYQTLVRCVDYRTSTVVAGFWTV